MASLLNTCVYYDARWGGGRSPAACRWGSLAGIPGGDPWRGQWWGSLGRGSLAVTTAGIPGRDNGRDPWQGYLAGTMAGIPGGNNGGETWRGQHTAGIPGGDNIRRGYLAGAGEHVDGEAAVVLLPVAGGALVAATRPPHPRHAGVVLR
eukprot:9041512-Pyramimonas_sp.AAC.1